MNIDANKPRITVKALLSLTCHPKQWKDLHRAATRRCWGPFRKLSIRDILSVTEIPLCGRAAGILYALGRNNAKTEHRFLYSKITEVLPFPLSSWRFLCVEKETLFDLTTNNRVLGDIRKATPKLRRRLKKLFGSWT